MKLVVGADHAGFPLKQLVIDTLTGLDHEVLDVGTYSLEPVDFPDIASALSKAIVDGRADRGIIVCGTGIGASIAANKIMVDLIRIYVDARWLPDEEFHRRVRKLEQLESRAQG
jgi:RpiB/LacA/LacB family sugar-phosphate isomerase